MKVSVNCKIENGKVSQNKTGVINAFSQFEGKEVTITIQRKRRQRSNEQNRYLWGCIYPIIRKAFAEAMGENFTIEQVHEIMKFKLNYREIINEDTGEVIVAPKSTTQNTKFEQEEYHQKLREFSLEWFNIIIPLPNEQIQIETP